jgi:hypothetical protein
VTTYDRHPVFSSECDSKWCVAAGCAMKSAVVTLNSCCSSCGVNAEMPDHHHHTVSVLTLHNCNVLGDEATQTTRTNFSENTLNHLQALEVCRWNLNTSCIYFLWLLSQRMLAVIHKCYGLRLDQPGGPTDRFSVLFPLLYLKTEAESSF